MEAIKRQASKLREQVAKQQQALRRQFGHFDPDSFWVDEAEIACRDQLHKLYTCTTAAKHFEKDIVHGIEGIVSVTSKQREIERKFAQDCSRYGLKVIAVLSPWQKRPCVLVCNPLRALVQSAELEDARLLVRRYDKLWQEVEAQAADVLRLRSKFSEGAKSDENFSKLQLAEEKLEDLKSRLMALGKEATSAMLSVEAHQQKITFRQLVVMLNAERSYHQNVLSALEKLLPEMLRLEQLSESELPEDAMQNHSHGLETEGNGDSVRSKGRCTEHEDSACYVAKAVHPFDAEAEGELSLLVGDIVVVQQVILGGWSKGECNGNTGWFPSPYVQRLHEVSEGNVTWANL
ncbi:SH3 domain-containing protein 2 [Bienertia sinuspersici]